MTLIKQHVNLKKAFSVIIAPQLSLLELKNPVSHVIQAVKLVLKEQQMIVKLVMTLLLLSEKTLMEILEVVNVDLGNILMKLIRPVKIVTILVKPVQDLKKLSV